MVLLDSSQILAEVTEDRVLDWFDVLPPLVGNRKCLCADHRAWEFNDFVGVSEPLLGDEPSVTPLTTIPRSSSPSGSGCLLELFGRQVVTGTTCLPALGHW